LNNPRAEITGRERTRKRDHRITDWKAKLKKKNTENYRPNEKIVQS